MKESIGNAFIFGIFVTFSFLCLFVLTAAINYSRAVKVKTRLVSLVEDYAESSAARRSDEGIDLIDFDDEDFSKMIEEELMRIGYRRNNGGFNQNSCPSLDGATLMNKNSAFNYCIYSYPSNRGYYYKVITYMYFDIPIIGQTLKFPISGETKVIYSLGV
jgi:hypothetical protein